MIHMNEYDLASAAERYDVHRVPNRAKLLDIVGALKVWADENSDGWAYWPKPARAAQKAMGHLESTTSAENGRRRWVDITDAELNAAIGPIKSFLTRQGAPYSTIGL